MVQHTVVFKLKHKENSAEETKFLNEAKKILSAIPTVINFECFRQVSLKNDFKFSFSMYFKNEADYKKYNEHPNHVNFVNERWVPEVETFLEIDYVKCEVKNK